MPRRPTTIQEELRQTRPFATASEEAAVALLRTAALLKRDFARHVEPHGLSLAQYNVLRILRGAGTEGLPTLAVRDRLIEEAPGITRLIDKLEAAGLVSRDRTGKDRRTVRCRITERGLAMLDEIERQVARSPNAVSDGIPDERDQRTLIELLARVRAGIPEGS